MDRDPWMRDIYQERVNTNATQMIAHHFERVREVLTGARGYTFNLNTFAFIKGLFFHTRNAWLKEEGRLIFEASPQKSRLQLAMIIFMVIFDMERNDEVTEENINFFFRTVPDRLLSRSELYRLILPAIREDFTDAFRERCNFYGSLNIDGANSESETPRRLYHKCRVSIRNELSRNGDLHNNIDSLVLPNSVKSYLRLEH